MKKKVVITVFVVLLVCVSVTFAACLDEVSKSDYDALLDDYSALKLRHDALKDEFDILESERDALESEKNVLKNDYEALMDSLPKILYNPELHHRTKKLSNIADLLYPKWFSEMGNRIFIINSKEKFDEVFTEEIRLAYNANDAKYIDESPDFEKDFPCSSIDFSKRMFVFYAYWCGHSEVKFALNSVQLHGRTLVISLRQIILGEMTESVETVQGLLVEFDKINIDVVDFDFIFLSYE